MLVPYISKEKVFYVDFERRKIVIGDVELDFGDVFAFLILILNESRIRKEVNSLWESIGE